MLFKGLFSQVLAIFMCFNKFDLNTIFFSELFGSNFSFLFFSVAFCIRIFFDPETNFCHCSSFRRFFFFDGRASFFCFCFSSVDIDNNIFICYIFHVMPLCVLFIFVLKNAICPGSHFFAYLLVKLCKKFLGQLFFMFFNIGGYKISCYQPIFVVFQNCIDE